MPKFNKDFLPVAKPSQPDLRSLELHFHIGAHNLACLGEQFANAAEAGRPNCVCCVNQILRGWGVSERQDFKTVYSWFDPSTDWEAVYEASRVNHYTSGYSTGKETAEALIAQGISLEEMEVTVVTSPDVDPETAEGYRDGVTAVATPQQ